MTGLSIFPPQNLIFRSSRKAVHIACMTKKHSSAGDQQNKQRFEKDEILKESSRSQCNLSVELQNFVVIPSHNSQQDFSLFRYNNKLKLLVIKKWAGKLKLTYNLVLSDEETPVFGPSFRCTVLMSHVVFPVKDNKVIPVVKVKLQTPTAT